VVMTGLGRTRDTVAAAAARVQAAAADTRNAVIGIGILAGAALVLALAALIYAHRGRHAG
jgi:hypothetical protein